MQSEELWLTQNPQLPALLILLFSSPPLSLFLSPPFRLPSPPSLFIFPSPFPSLFLSRFLSIFLSFFFFLSLSFPFSLSLSFPFSLSFFFLHGVQKWRAILLLLERSRFQLPPLRAATPRATFLVLLLFLFQNLSKLEPNV